MIDHKFIIKAHNPCKPEKIYTEEDAILFCAKDKAVPAMLVAYINECTEIGCGREHIESIVLMLGRVNAYQATIESRIPDTETDCEIDRCIGGHVHSNEQIVKDNNILAIHNIRELMVSPSLKEIQNSISCLAEYIIKKEQENSDHVCNCMEEIPNREERSNDNFKDLNGQS